MRYPVLSLHRFRWLRACAEGSLALLFACAGAVHAQQVAAPPSALPPEAITNRAAEIPPAAPMPTCPAPVAAPAPAPCDGGCPDPVDWTKIPPVTPMPRPGFFIIPPKGPGYYSFLDLVTDNNREAPPKNPWPPVGPIFNSFYDADFRYLDDPKNTQHDWVDPLKRIHCGCDWLLSFGGEERIRYMNEVDARLSGRDDTYYLNRTRLYGDLWYKDIFRVYAEFIDAQSWDNDLVPRPIDQNHSDLQNLFFELKVGEIDGNPIYVRVGRQELLEGSQRLVSPLDWANTRRTFEGIKGYYRSEQFDVDAFWTRPENISVSHFDAADPGRQFAGLYTSYKPEKGTSIDLYYLYLDQTTPVVGASLGRRGYDTSTIGARYVGDKNDILWDFEGMYQFGDHGDVDVSATALTAELGYHFTNLPMNPIFWVGNDYASGDHSGHTHGAYGTFNQLFPFGHYYFGFLDLVGRQNIDDMNMQLTLNPVNWITVGAQGHFFYLDSAKDALYNASGGIQRIDPTGHSGKHVGNEVDFTCNVHLTPHQDVFFGYSHLFAGEFLQNTGNGHSPDLAYVQYSFKW